MKIASVAAVKARLDDYLRADASPVVVTRNGKRVGVLLALEDEEEIERLALSYSPKFRAIIDGAQRSIDAGKGIPAEEFWRRMKEKNRSQEKVAKRKRARTQRR